MKRFFSVVAMTIALATVLLATSCNKNSNDKAPLGTPIGQVFMQEQEGGVYLTDSTGNQISETYAEILLEDKFIVCMKPDSTIDLANLQGVTFAHCASYEVKPYYTTTEESEEKNFILTNVGNGNHLAFDYQELKRLVAVEGIKEATLPLDNGYLFYKLKGKWGIAKQGAEEPILSAVCSSVAFISTPKKVYFWVQSPDFTGIIDEEGTGVKAMSLKALNRSGKVLWKEDEVSAIAVKKI